MDDTSPDRKADSEGVTTGLELAEEETPKETPYDNIQAAPGEGVVVPPDAPTATKRKKGFFSSIADTIGIGADDDDPRVQGEGGEADPRYGDRRDPNAR